jgi:response regulator NasT
MAGARPLRIVVAEDEPNTRQYLLDLLARRGHEAVAVGTGKHLVELSRASPSDLIIAGIKLPDMDGIEAAVEMDKGGGRFPVVLLAADHESELLDRAVAAGTVMAYLAKPVKEQDILAAVHLALHRYRLYQEARREADSLRQALEDRKLVERAKGAVMRRMGLDEEEAFRRLERIASHRNRKLAEVAKDVLAAEEVFREVDEAPG